MNTPIHTPNFNELAWKILPWLADILCGFLVWWAVQINSEIKSIRLDIQEVKEWRSSHASSQYTASAQAAYAEKQAAELTKIWAKIADVQQQWLRDLSDIKSSMARIEAQVELEKKKP